MEEEVMLVLVVVESLFGNTRAVAEAIAEGVAAAGDRAVVRSVAEPVDELLEQADLLVVGGPTHAFSMTRENTRADAVRQGATGLAGPGLRGWTDAVPVRRELPVLTFDTRVRHFPGSAAKAARTALRDRGFTSVRRGESFFVTGTPGPLAAGELDRARAWGGTLRHVLGAAV